MARTWLVEDDARYRGTLDRNLVLEGHAVRMTSGGSEAFPLGSRTQPCVLVADSMPSNRVHGLDMVQMLRLLIPGLPGVVIAGVPSLDLHRMLGPFVEDRELGARSSVSSEKSCALPRECGDAWTRVSASTNLKQAWLVASVHRDAH